MPSLKWRIVVEGCRLEAAGSSYQFNIPRNLLPFRTRISEDHVQVTTVTVDLRPHPVPFQKMLKMSSFRGWSPMSLECRTINDRAQKYQSQLGAFGTWLQARNSQWGCNSTTQRIYFRIRINVVVVCCRQCQIPSSRTVGWFFTRFEHVSWTRSGTFHY